MERPDFFSLKNGEKVKLPFTNQEYDRRVTNLRTVMSNNNLDMIILTSMHNIAYYTGFIYCSFGRPYGCVVTKDKISTISANIDASQPWRRSHCDNVIYTDWKRDNFLRAIVSIIGRDEPPKTIGLENDHFAAALYLFLIAFFIASTLMHLAERTLQPEHFGSIPAAMWWSIITLTTVGYGDVSPLSILGKIIGGGTALMGVCTVALLTGIMANAFANQVQGRRTIFEAEVAHALEDGTITEDEQRLLDELRTRFDFSEEYARAIIDLAREKLEGEDANSPPSAGA